MNNPLISIIIPIYNVKAYLRECLESVLNQSYKNLDIILIDDASTDESLNIALEYLNQDERIFLISKQNAGQSSARNLGLEFIKGTQLRSFFEEDEQKDILSFTTTHSFKNHTKIIKKEEINSQFTLIQKRYIKTKIENINDFIIQELPPIRIHFLDSDDYLLKDCIASCVRMMLEKDLDLCAHDIYRYLQSEARIDTKHYFEIPHNMPKKYYDLALDALIACNKYSFVFTWQGMFKASLLNKYKLRFTHGIYNEDNDFGIILFALAKKIFFLHEKLLVYRVREHSSSSKTISKRQDMPQYLKHIRDYFKDYKSLKKYYHYYCVVKSGIVINDFYRSYLTDKERKYHAFFINCFAWHCNLLRMDLKIDPLNIIKLVKTAKVSKMHCLKHSLVYLLRHPKNIKNIKNLFYL